MKPKVLLLALFLFAASANAATLQGRCVAVTDGDTIKVQVDTKTIKVRLNGVDAPEKRQAFGAQAKAFTASEVLGKDVTIYTTGKSWDRVLAWVFIDKRSLSREIVAAGCAWWYFKYAPHNTTLATLQAQAKAAKRGLWSEPNPVPPWEFRKAH